MGGRERKGVSRRAVVDVAPTVAAYVRVSTSGQDYSSQRHAIEAAARAAGAPVQLWFGDVATGSKMDRPQLIRLRDQIRLGKIGVLWVWRIDRITRSGIVDCVSCIAEIQRRGCIVRSVMDGFPLDGAAGEICLAMVAWAAQQERLKMLENQAAARAKCVASGRHWGKPAIPTDVRRLVRDLASAGHSVRSIAKEAQISKSSAWNILRDSVPPKEGI